ncbi:MAG: DUF2520 domain-containing protein [Nitriliruptorales bacterium]|nr:DUF2520 domain-containing protein [Nitriliruptorales bacterium]
MKRTAVIGPGRVGTALGMALAQAGYDVFAVADQDRRGVDSFVQRVPTARPLAAVDASRDAELVIVAVPDDALADLVAAVARDDGVAEGSRWVHVSGGYGTDVLRPAHLAGAAVAACHPAQTFPDAETGFAALPGCSWAVTAQEQDLGWARVLVTDLRGRPVAVPAGSRTLYHAGLAVGSNATVTVVALARDLLLGAGIENPGDFLGPLVTTSAANAASSGAAALTGPVRRGDAGTVAAHLEELRGALPEAVDAYLAVARLALGYARRSGLDEQQAAAVARVLDH